jgi:hypothetical protein
MSELRDFVAELLERRGAVVDRDASGLLQVMAPDALRTAWNWPELAQLGFDGVAPPGAIAIGLEDDWIERLGALLGEDGRLAARLLPAPEGRTPAAEDLLGRTLDLGNAVWRPAGGDPGWTWILLLAFRIAAMSDEKRESLVWLAINCGTSAVLDAQGVAALRGALAQQQAWQVPAPDQAAAAGPVWTGDAIAARLRRPLARRVDEDLAPFVAAMRRRLARDAARIHAYHDDLLRTSRSRLDALRRAGGARAPDARSTAAIAREERRAEAIQRDYVAKLADLRNNYALAVDVSWVQGVAIATPVHRLRATIRRRKGERTLAIDWLPALRRVEPPVDDWQDSPDSDGFARLACDERLHLVAPAGLAACASCGRPVCRACHPGGCPRCAGGGATIP